MTDFINKPKAKAEQEKRKYKRYIERLKKGSVIKDKGENKSLKEF